MDLSHTDQRDPVRVVHFRPCLEIVFDRSSTTDFPLNTRKCFCCCCCRLYLVHKCHEDQICANPLPLYGSKMYQMHAIRAGFLCFLNPIFTRCGNAAAASRIFVSHRIFRAPHKRACLVVAGRCRWLFSRLIIQRELYGVMAITFTTRLA